MVVLVDRDGNQAMLENRNMDLGPLFRQICARVPAGDTRIEDPTGVLRPYHDEAS